ncbi:MAG TPA: ATP-binding cassette domain-containing protein, partial [Frankiaceae bacterium]|nr:ATP-binding cassette domain-containing protein [Frankiaceae bacterium]
MPFGADGVRARSRGTGRGVTNLVNVEGVGKAYGHGPVLTDVSLGIGANERIGVVGRNGGGKSTLLRLLMRA